MPSQRSRRSSSWRTALVLGVSSLAARAAAQVSISGIPFKQTGAQSLSPTLSPSYGGMGIEPSNLLSFTGTDQRNDLTYQLLQNLANYTGKPPHIRLGGNAGDNMLYDATVNTYTLQKNPNAQGSGRVDAQTDGYFYGPKYFQALDNYLPPGTPITYQLNLAYQGSDAMSRIIQQAELALDSLKKVKIVGMEIGNEPDLFIYNQYRNSSYTVYDYGGEWGERAQALYQQVLAPRNISRNFFEPAATATTATNSGHQYRIDTLVNTNIAVDNGVYVAGWSQHDYFYYVGVSSFNLTTSYLLDLSRTVRQFNEWSNQAQQALITGKPYFLREMGSVGPGGIQGISDTFANALWTLNFFLFASTQQVSSVQIHLTDISYGSPWQPIVHPVDGSPPHVRPSYYAFAAVFQLIGTTCSTRVAPLSISSPSSDYTNRLGGYSIYQHMTLSAIVLLNTLPSSATITDKNSISFSISVPEWKGQTVYVSTLSAAGSDSTTNTTWNGISYEQTANGAPTIVDRNAAQRIRVDSSGAFSVNVRDSQAVVINLGSVVGSNTVVDVQACAELARLQAEGVTAGADGTVSGTAPTFRATSGFRSNEVLSKQQIIGISVGGGIFLVVALASLITLCVCCKRRRDRKRRARLSAQNMSSATMPLKAAAARENAWDSPRGFSDAGFDTPRTYAASGFESPVGKHYPIEMEDSPRTFPATQPPARFGGANGGYYPARGDESPRFQGAARREPDNHSGSSRRPLFQ